MATDYPALADRLATAIVDDEGPAAAIAAAEMLAGAGMALDRIADALEDIASGLEPVILESVTVGPVRGATFDKES